MMIIKTPGRRFEWFCALIGALTTALGCSVEQCPPMTSLGPDNVCHEDPEEPASAKGEIRTDETEVSCAKDADCEAPPAVCMSPEKCQGQRAVVACEKSKCVEKMVDDDSACGDAKPASACELFKAVSCNGQKTQQQPECLTACVGDEDCDEDASCSEGKCVADGSIRDGADCTDSAQCQSGHCTNNICCQSGDCCTDVAQCPSGRYGGKPVCDVPGSCQGTRKEALCENNMCSSEIVEDDSACNVQIVAKRCMDTPNIMCSGEMSQAAVPPCGTAPAKTMSEMPAAEMPAAEMPPAKEPADQPERKPVSPIAPGNSGGSLPMPKCVGAGCCTTSATCTDGAVCMREANKAQPCAGASDICRCVASEMMPATQEKPGCATACTDGKTCVELNSTKPCNEGECECWKPECAGGCGTGLMCANVNTKVPCTERQCACVRPMCTGGTCCESSLDCLSLEYSCVADEDPTDQCLGEKTRTCHCEMKPKPADETEKQKPAEQTPAQPPAQEMQPAPPMDCSNPDPIYQCGDGLECSCIGGGCRCEPIANRQG